MTYPTIFLMRHGQTEWNVAARLQGRFDSELTDVGRAQALRQGELLAQIVSKHPKISVLSSPQGRAVLTATLATSGLNIDLNQDDRLREISAGSWDGAFLETIQHENGHVFEQARNAFELMFLAPDGEGQQAVFERCNALLSEQNKPIVMVTHGATLCVLRGILRGMAFDEMLDLSHEQGCIYALEGGGETIFR